MDGLVEEPVNADGLLPFASAASPDEDEPKVEDEGEIIAGV